ncbi:MAG: hypothetical protein RL181_2134 [Bacteroidota bacterium]|jgi:hypothetical protein
MRFSFYTLPLLAFSLICTASQAQSFPDRCTGTWSGRMYIYANGALKDSVEVVLTVAQLPEPNAWTWKTEYLSEKMPMVKDYVLRAKDAEKGWFVTDEGDGIELQDFVFGNKMYSAFDVGGILLTASYELLGDTLVFEVTSGRKMDSKEGTPLNFSVNNLQRVVFRRRG